MEEEDEETDLHSLLHGRSVINTHLGTDARANASVDLDTSGATGGASSTGGVNPLLGGDQGSDRNTSRSSRGSATSSVPSLGNHTLITHIYIHKHTTRHTNTHTLPFSR